MMTRVKATLVAVVLLAMSCSGRDPFIGETRQAVTPLIKARIAILFDTSYSMYEHVCYPQDSTDAGTGGGDSGTVLGRKAPTVTIIAPSPAANHVTRPIRTR